MPEFDFTKNKKKMKKRHEESFHFDGALRVEIQEDKCTLRIL